jgi:hypothetical protein
MLDPGMVPDGVPGMPMQGEAVAAAVVAHWEATGVATAAQRSEEAGNMVGEVAGDHDDVDLVT